MRTSSARALPAGERLLPVTPKFVRTVQDFSPPSQAFHALTIDCRGVRRGR